MSPYQNYLMKERKLLLHEQMEEHGEQVEEIELLRFCLDKLQFYKKIPVRAKCLIVIDFIPIVVVAPPPSTS